MQSKSIQPPSWQLDAFFLFFSSEFAKNAKIEKNIYQTANKFDINREKTSKKGCNHTTISKIFFISLQHQLI
jgi:hypothetical protein